MSKIGVSLKINVLKLDKARFHVGAKGTYCDMTVFINLDEQDQFKQNGIIKQKTEQGEDVEMPILGGATIFWESEPRVNNPEPVNTEPNIPDDDTIPF